MNANIRVIKRTEREATRKAKENRAAETGNSRQATRDIASHVNTWIKELQQRHKPDPRRAFANLFANAATSTAD